MNNTERLTWAELPKHVQHWVNTTLSSPVTKATSQAGGFSLGTADRLICTNGTRAFLKAVNKTQQKFTAKLHLREGTILQHLPAHAPAPNYIAHFEDTEWAAILTQDIEGTHPQPTWTPQQTQSILKALAELAQINVRNFPKIENTRTSMEEELGSWKLIHQKILAVSDYEHQKDHPDFRIFLDFLPWINENAERFAQRITEHYAPLLEGDYLNHTDLRADNILMTTSCQVIIVDWPWACAGNPAFDSAHLLLDVILVHPSITAEEFLMLVPETTRLTKSFLVNTVLYAAGFYAWAAQFPADAHTGASLPALRLYRAVRLVRWRQRNVSTFRE